MTAKRSIERNERRIVACLLAASALTLAVMVPGGPVETRHFSHLHPVLLGVFNTFLVGLGLVSAGAIPFVLRGRRSAHLAAAAAGAAYALVYLLDLGGLFPSTPDSMPPALLALELAGAAMSVPLMVFATGAARRAGAGGRPITVGSSIRVAVLVVVALAVGVAVVAFATIAAMRPG